MCGDEGRVGSDGLLHRAEPERGVNRCLWLRAKILGEIVRLMGFIMGFADYLKGWENP